MAGLLLFQLALSHPYACKQPLTYISISNFNKKLTAAPRWTLVVYLLWSIVGPISRVSRHVFTSLQGQCHTTLPLVFIK